MNLIRETKISNIANNIKTHRLKTGLNSKEFAKKIAVSYQKYSEMERGIYTPSLKKLLEICEILKITPNDLLLDESEIDDSKVIFDDLNSSMAGIANVIEYYERKRVEILTAKENNDKEAERIALDEFIQLFAKTNEDYWEIADFLYHKKLNELILKASDNTSKKIMAAQNKIED